MIARYLAHPERFVNGPPRLEKLPRAVYLDPSPRLILGAVPPIQMALNT